MGCQGSGRSWLTPWTYHSRICQTASISMAGQIRILATALTLALSVVSCRRPPVNVDVVFATSWKFDTASLIDSDQSSIKRHALETLRHAYAGFDVRFAEGATGARLIRVEDTPYVSNPQQLIGFGAAGVTYPLSTVSSVRVDVLWNAEMAAAGCTDITHCTRTRTELLNGLGQGIGATAAHELGHQAAFGFATDLPCEECYDGNTSTSFNHFFGNKHWSDRAMQMMRRALPPG
jgi:hypothetical protein